MQLEEYGVMDLLGAESRRSLVIDHVAMEGFNAKSSLKSSNPESSRHCTFTQELYLCWKNTLATVFSVHIFSTGPRWRFLCPTIIYAGWKRRQS